MSQPRNFGLTGEGTLAGTVDLGSNSEQFWVYVKAPGVTNFVYASHVDFESGRKTSGRNTVRAGLGDAVLGTDDLPGESSIRSTLRVRENTSDRTVTPAWPAITPTGIAIRKEIVFDADDVRWSPAGAKARRPRQSRQLICSEIRAVKSVPIPRPNARSAEVPVQYPTHVVLRWEGGEKLEMDLAIEGASGKPTPYRLSGPANVHSPQFPQRPGHRPCEIRIPWQLSIL